MLSLKKSSIFFTKISKFYFNIFKFELFAIYNFYGSFFSFFNKLNFSVQFKDLNYILINTSFLKIIFKKCKNYFSLLSPQSLIFFFFNYNNFLE